jgi:hypothetical protein
MLDAVTNTHKTISKGSLRIRCNYQQQEISRETSKKISRKEERIVLKGRCRWREAMKLPQCLQRKESIE